VGGHNGINGCPVLVEGPRYTRLIVTHQPAVTGDIGGQDGGKLAGHAHGPSGPAWSNAASLTHDRLAQAWAARRREEPSLVRLRSAAPPLAQAARREQLAHLLPPDGVARPR